MANGPNQLELFPVVPKHTKPIAGLAVHLDRHCRCGAAIAVIVQGKGPHVAGLKCPACDRFRQWLPREFSGFLAELVATYGRPGEPVHIFEHANSDRRPAHGNPENEHERHGENTMVDARKYAGTRYRKVDDVRAKPLKLRIAQIKTGKYDKLDAYFDDGSVLSLNATNTSTLITAWGWDTEAWHGKDVQLELGTLEYGGKEQEAVICSPLSPPLDPDEIPKPPPPADFDDEVVF